jgi:hypothetical protein
MNFGPLTPAADAHRLAGIPALALLALVARTISELALAACEAGVVAAVAAADRLPGLLAQHARHAQDEQGLGLVGTKPAERQPVALHELAPAAGSGLGDDGHAGRGQRFEVAVDRPDGHPELGRKNQGRQSAARLQQQHQGQQPVGAHRTSVDRIADIRCQRYGETSAR